MRNEYKPLITLSAWAFVLKLIALFSAGTVAALLLVIAAEFTEILFFLFLSTGLEKMPAQGIVTFSPYSHSLVSGVLASLLFFAIVSLIYGKRLSQ
ncbi:MAG: hypothetical protein JXA95_00360 [Spirochaetales bacterium]|nr:hypothetical protein [Spirochaetales bacterium]